MIIIVYAKYTKFKSLVKYELFEFLLKESSIQAVLPSKFGIIVDGCKYSPKRVQMTVRGTQQPILNGTKQLIFKIGQNS